MVESVLCARNWIAIHRNVCTTCVYAVIVCGKMQDQQILLNTNLFKSRILRLCHLVKEGATLALVGAKSIVFSPLHFIGCCLCNWTIAKNGIPPQAQ